MGFRVVVVGGSRFPDMHAGARPITPAAARGGGGVRASPCPWSPATAEIRRLAQDALRPGSLPGPRAESPAAPCPASHPHYRPPNPGGGGSVGGRPEPARADSDSLSSSGTPAANPKLTPRLCRSPPQHVTRAPRPSRDGGGGGGGGAGSPRVLPEMLTPRPGPGSSGDSPLSTPRDRSAFLAPPAKTPARAEAAARVRA
jgi:hypothetical protein